MERVDALVSASYSGCVAEAIRHNASLQGISEGMVHITHKLNPGIPMAIRVIEQPSEYTSGQAYVQFLRKAEKSALLTSISGRSGSDQTAYMLSKDRTAASYALDLGAAFQGQSVPVGTTDMIATFVHPSMLPKECEEIVTEGIKATHFDRIPKIASPIDALAHVLYERLPAWSTGVAMIALAEQSLFGELAVVASQMVGRFSLGTYHVVEAKARAVAQTGMPTSRAMNSQLSRIEGGLPAHIASPDRLMAIAVGGLLKPGQDNEVISTVAANPAWSIQIVAPRN